MPTPMTAQKNKNITLLESLTIFSPDFAKNYITTQLFLKR
jgi:hypothetical protein